MGQYSHQISQKVNFWLISQTYRRPLAHFELFSQESCFSGKSCSIYTTAFGHRWLLSIAIIDFMEGKIEQMTFLFLSF